MPFKDILPYVRMFFKEELGQVIWSSHGIWRSDKDGFTETQYTYYFYTPAGRVLTGTEYKNALVNMGTNSPVERLDPGPGAKNYVFLPLEDELAYFTAKNFVQQKIYNDNPNNLALLAFKKNDEVQAMNLRLLDRQLLPAINYPLGRPVHMVVCRSETGPQFDFEAALLAGANRTIGNMNVFNSITEDML